MKHRTKEEIEEMARKAAKRDIALLRECGLPVTLELVRAMARKAAEAQAEAALSVPDQEQEKPDASTERRS